MRLPQPLVNLSCGLAAPMAVTFLQDSIQTMLPWLVAMAAVVMCDLAFGIRKSRKLGIHVSGSMAFRETMGKMIVYATFVIMVSMVEAAARHSLKIAMWSCLFVCAIEGCSIISNLLKPYGVSISLDWAVKTMAKRIAGIDESDAEGMIDRDRLEKVKDAERARWEHRQPHEYGGKKSCGNVAETEKKD